MAYAKKENKKDSTTYDIEVVSARIVSETAVSFNMTINGITIYDCWLNERTNSKGETFDTISLPSYKGKDGKYYSYVFVPLKDISEEIIRKVKSIIG